MIFERIESYGIAHYSYLIGDGNEAAVIDPRRDVGVYINKAREKGLKIRYILETHRNEDYITGSMELSEKTGAKIYISGHENLGHVYGELLYDGDTLDIGDIRIKGIHTPGHTLGHMSYALYEKKRKSPYMVFTGDCLFMGDIGRTDFYGEKNLEKTTGLMYESIFEKLMQLGDEVIVCPAHGPGSACGESMEERPYTTIGYERKNNSKLQFSSKSDFIEKHSRMRIKPRYFEAMEIYNTKGADYVGEEVLLYPLTPEDISDTGAILIDTGEKESFAGGHIPGALFFSRENISTYIGTVLDHKQPVALIGRGDDINYLNEIYWLLKRIGFDNIKGYLPDANYRWQRSGKDLASLKTINGSSYTKPGKNEILLDIRNLKSPAMKYENYINIPLQLLYSEYKKIPEGSKVNILCSSGDRATSAASYLIKKGYDARVITGGTMTYIINEEEE